jgi:hypothetical protein
VIALSSVNLRSSREEDDYDLQEDLFGVIPLIKDAHFAGASSPGRLNFFLAINPLAPEFFLNFSTLCM